MQILRSLVLTGLVCSAVPLMAQDSVAKAPAKAAAKAPAPKAGPVLKAAKDEKVCSYRFPDGEKRSWVCKKVEPCCAWDAIKYVKCGSTITNCL